MPETPYMETEALLAILNGDRRGAAAIVRRMLDGEVTQFYHEVQVLQDVVFRETRRRRWRTQLLAQGGTGRLVPEGGTSD